MPDDKKKALEEQEEDIISKAIGEFGKWQLLVTFLLSLFNIPCTWHIFAPTFHSAERDTWCGRPDAFRDVAPSLWKNCTGQLADFCTVLDVVAANVTGSDLCARTSELDRVKCHAWEFGGRGRCKPFICLKFNFIFQIL